MAHWRLRMPATTSIYLWFISVPTAHWALRTHKMARSTWRWCIVAFRAQWGSRRYTMAQPICHSCIMHIVAPVGHWSSLWTQNIRKWIDPDVAHIMVPTAHWGPSTPWMVWCTKFRYMVVPRAHWGDIKWLPGLIGDLEHTKMARSWHGSYSGSYGSLGTQNTWNGEMNRMLKYGGPWGSMGMDNALSS